jgi:hypothetical protein
MGYAAHKKKLDEMAGDRVSMNTNNYIGEAQLVLLWFVEGVRTTPPGCAEGVGRVGR